MRRWSTSRKSIRKRQWPCCSRSESGRAIPLRVAVRRRDQDVSCGSTDIPAAAVGSSVRRARTPFTGSGRTSRSARSSRGPSGPSRPMRRSASFSASGEGIVWAVADSGIEGDHPHFKLHKNLDPDPLVTHATFTADNSDPLIDEFGHGTHVAGIIAGELGAGRTPIRAFERRPATRESEIAYRSLAARVDLRHGPELQARQPQGAGRRRPRRCRAASSRRIAHDPEGQRATAAASAIHGRQHERRLRVRPGVVRVRPEPAVRRGGSAGAVRRGRRRRGGQHRLRQRSDPSCDGPQAAGMDLTINDPGNAELAITVGSTHRDMPHTYGVSYFSSKGPTGDGRLKPDLVAPGEKIVSCASGKKPARTRRARSAAGGASTTSRTAARAWPRRTSPA